MTPLIQAVTSWLQVRGWLLLLLITAGSGLVWFLEDQSILQLQRENWQNRQQFHIAAKEVWEERMLRLLDEVRHVRVNTERLLNQEGASARIAEEFLYFGEASQGYDQIRLLSNTGQEVSRVNFSAGAPRVVPTEELQDKSQREYFQEGQLLPRGTVLFSELDLNQENGVVEEPYKPVIRVVAPVFDPAGVRAGMVVMNYLGSGLLNSLTRVSASQETQELLLDTQGRLFVGFGSEKQWGFLEAGDWGDRLQAEHPLTWETVRSATPQCGANEEGLFCSTPYAPIRTARQQAGVLQLERRTEAPWFFVTFLSAEAFQQQNTTLRTQLAWSAAGAWLALMLLVGWGLRVLNTWSTRSQELSQVVQKQARLISLGEITTAMAHEINSPLAQVYLTLDQVLLELERADIRKSRLVRSLERAQQACKHISQIIEDIRTFGRFQEGQGNSVFSLKEVLQRSENVLRSRLLTHQVQLKKECPADLPWALGVPSKMEQVFVNLLSNAIDAMRQQPRRQIDLRVQVRKASSGSEMLEVRVQDSGPGVPEALKERVFEPFFTTKPLGKGRGMGLAIAHGLMREQGGELRCEPMPSGACFVVTLQAQGMHYEI